MPPRRDPDPFAPIEGAVTVILNLFIALLLIFAFMSVFQIVTEGSSDVSIATIGDEDACALVDNEAVPASTDVPQRGMRRDIAHVHAEEVEVCITHPTTWQKVSSALGPVGDLVFGPMALWLTRRVIRGARREGLFTDGTARRTRELGWFLLVMTLGWPFVAAAGRGVVVDAAVRSRDWTFMLFHPGVPVALVVVSLGVLTIARVLRRAVPLQQEVDATI